MRTDSDIYAELYHKQRNQTKKRGWRTGASPGVLFMLCMESVRSDHPSLFNQNPFIMRTDMDKCGQCPDKPLTADRIIKELIGSAPPEDMKKDLNSLFMSWVQHEELTHGDWKDSIISTYIYLNELIDSVIQFKALKS